VALLQHLLALATGCIAAQHVPSADVAHQPRADVAFSQSFSIQTSRIMVPVVVDVLRGKAVAGRPLLGETQAAEVALDTACPTVTAPKAR
jgi:hypothetical protein